MIHPVDLLLLFVLFVVMPTHSAREYRRYVAKIEAGGQPERPQQYRRGIVFLWMMLAVLVAVWWYLARPVDALGVTSPGGVGFWAAVIAVAAGVAYLLFVWQKCRNMPASERKDTLDSLGQLTHMLPQDDRELRWFFALSVSAGVVEEFVYRGFAIWILGLVMPLWAAVIVSSIGFGLAHSYQGKAGMVKTAGAGLLLAILYIGSGSIWLPIVAHILADILQGFAIRELFRDRGASGDAADVPA